MKGVAFVTSNQSKVREASEILGMPVESVAMELDEPQTMDLETVIRRKVEHAYQELKRPVMVDDSGVYCDAWNGFPGPFIKFASQTIGYEGLAAALGKNTHATWRVCVGYTDGTVTLIATGETTGIFTGTAQGDGFAFDPYFLPDGFDGKSYAELGMETKHATSARGQAFRDLKRQLEALSNSQTLS